MADLPIVYTPARVGEILKKAFKLRDGIKALQLTVTRAEVTLSVDYFVSDTECKKLENLEEFRLVPK